MTQSWGGIRHSTKTNVVDLYWADQARTLINQAKGKVLAFGLGRSYGDVCLNSGGTLLRTTGYRHVHAYCRESGLLTCSSGVSIGEILEMVIPEGWFIPVSPGTKFVTLGGAIANDIHGKNHHSVGTIGNHILEIHLLRSSGEVLKIKPEDSLFQATVGGLGLTGLILSAKIQLVRHPSYFRVEKMKFYTLDQYFQFCRESDQRFPYTVAWIDCTRTGRGIYMRAEPVECDAKPRLQRSLAVPFYFPQGTLSRFTVSAFNLIYSYQFLGERKVSTEFYDRFLYPLDGIAAWNRIYGRSGFFQYQFVVKSIEAVKQVMKIVADSNQGSFLGVMKQFGAIRSPGMLSFPMEGTTVALDFANQGLATRNLFTRLDRIVCEAGGRIYPAKDACMEGSDFQRTYPNLDSFLQFIDPKFSSDFWQRMNL